MRRIFIFGYYGFKNAGDDAMLESIINSIKKINTEVNISVLTYNAKYTKTKHKVDVISRSKIFEIVSAIKDCDLIVSGGGSLLQDVTSSRSLIFYLGLIFLAKLFRKKVMFYGNGYGPVNRRFNKLLIKKLLPKVDLITLRDEISKEELKKLGITHNVEVTIDPTFTMKACDTNRIDEIFSIENIPIDKELVGISIRRWKNDEKIKETIASAINHISELGARVVLIPMKYPDDLDFSNEVREMCKTKPYIIENYYKPEEILGIISKLTMLVGIRLHSLIFAAIENIPMVAIEYDPKVKGFIKLANQESVGDIRELDPINLCLSIDKVYSNRENYKKVLCSKKPLFEEKALKTAKMAVDLLYEE
ncbi:MAG: polysaccharide pyruvyl transferase CsaB [Tissierellales bacterium]